MTTLEQRQEYFARLFRWAFGLSEELDQFGLPEQWNTAPDGSGISHKSLDTGHHDRRLARRLEDPDFKASYDREVEAMQQREAMVRGERVTVLGPKPPDWEGLGASDPKNTVLVRYPDGEQGAVPEDAISDPDSAA